MSPRVTSMPRTSPHRSERKGGVAIYRYDCGVVWWDLAPQTQLYSNRAKIVYKKESVSLLNTIRMFDKMEYSHVV